MAPPAAAALGTQGCARGGGGRDARRAARKGRAHASAARTGPLPEGPGRAGRTWATRTRAEGQELRLTEGRRCSQVFCLPGGGRVPPHTKTFRSLGASEVLRSPIHLRSNLPFPVWCTCSPWNRFPKPPFQADFGTKSVSSKLPGYRPTDRSRRSSVTWLSQWLTGTGYCRKPSLRGSQALTYPEGKTKSESPIFWLKEV